MRLSHLGIILHIGTEYSNTSIVKSVNGTRLDFYISLQNNNVGHALSDTDYWTKATLNAGKNIGEIVTSVIPLSDSGLHLLDGTVLSGGGVYADFVNYIASIYDASLSYFTTEADWQNSVSKYGSCGKFVYDSTNNTVRLPKIVGFIEGTSGVSALGNLTQAGLPNISGWARFRTLSALQGAGGALKNSYTPGGLNGFGDTMRDNSNIQVDFNASYSNAIYGRSSTVQPQSIKVLYYIVLANDAKNTLQVDIDEILSDLANKADVDGSNMVSSVKNFDGQWTIVNVAIASEVTYTQEQIVTYDISSYLPNDNYDYEVLFTAYLRTAETANSATGCHLYTGSQSSNVINIRMGRCVTRTNASVNASGNGILPIYHTDRKVTWQNTDSNGTSGNCGLRMMAYRRIGTNA